MKGEWYDWIKKGRSLNELNGGSLNERVRFIF